MRVREVNSHASIAAIIAFNVEASKPIQTLAMRGNIKLSRFEIIYHLLDKVKELMIARIPPEYYPEIKGEAEVLQVFEINVSKKRQSKIAGGRVMTGTISRGLQARIVRDEVCIWRGDVKALKHFKKDVTEAAKGSEFGIGFDGFEDLRAGDRVQSFVDVQKTQTL